ncbi:MAG: Lsr2 family protein [Micrococcales bacterium]|nr:Lsr2 family protein [Micrococcales bacterium]
MAQRVQVFLVDDIDGGKADETVTFALDGVTYQIDLSSYHAGELRNAVGQWTSKARRATTTRAARGRSPRRNTGPSDTPLVRAWARSHGYAVSDRGRIPADVRQAYNAAH